MKILGIDPGMAIVGYGLIDYTNDEISYLVFFEKLREFIVVGIGFDMENDFRTPVGFVAGRDFVPFRAAARPYVGFVAAERSGSDFDLVRDHKRRIETYAELTDYGYVVFV